MVGLTAKETLWDRHFTKAPRRLADRSFRTLYCSSDGVSRERHGINPKTVAKWRRRTSLEDLSGLDRAASEIQTESAPPHAGTEHLKGCCGLRSIRYWPTEACCDSQPLKCPRHRTTVEIRRASSARIMRVALMPDRTTCKYCSRNGLVRREHVIKAGNSTVAYYCGACDRSWQVADERVLRSSPVVRLKRRSRDREPV